MATTTRNSQSEVVGRNSPYRSKRSGTRNVAAARLVAKRTTEIAALMEALRTSPTAAQQRVLKARIKASRANLQAWLKYIDNEAPRETRAVMNGA